MRIYSRFSCFIDEIFYKMRYYVTSIYEKKYWRKIMVNDNEELVRDYDEDIQDREALIKEAEQIDGNAEWNVIAKEISELRRSWKRIAYWDSVYEEQLIEKFDSIIDSLYSKRREGFQSNQAMKQELIQQAQKLSMSNDWNKASDGMADLMQQWKAIGTAGKEDDTLWEAFNAARQTFYDRKHEYWENLQAKFGNALQIKQAVVAEAKTIVDSEEWQSASEKFKELMNQWKAAGSAGREHEDRLWNEFNDLRQKFYDRRNVHYDQLHAQQDERYGKKEALVEKASEIAKEKSYTKENTEKMRNLNTEWKSIGSCGKEREDQIWDAFRSVMDDYFNGLKQFNEEKHQQWRQRMMDARKRKQELLQKQKWQLKRMQEEMVGLLGQRAIDEMNEDIADKEDFIQQLEAEIADIEKALEK